MELSIKDIKELIETGGAAQKDAGILGRFVGQYCICRASAAGVHAGEVVEIQPTADGLCTVVLHNSRRLWSWTTNSGIALSGVAQGGINASKSKVDSVMPTHAVLGVCEILPCTQVAKESINGK